MRIDELEQALDRYGGDTGRWPDALRRQAEGLIATDPRAASLARAAAGVEEAVGTLMRPMAIDAALIGRITSGLGGHELALRPTGRLAALAGAAMVAFSFSGLSTVAICSSR